MFKLAIYYMKNWLQIMLHIKKFMEELVNNVKPFLKNILIIYRNISSLTKRKNYEEENTYQSLILQ